MVSIKNKEQIEKMREACRVANLAQKAVEAAIRPGISTWELDKIAERTMRENGAIGAMMSGSGPTVFGLFENRAAAREAQRKIRESGLTKQVYVTNVHNVRRK